MTGRLYILTGPSGVGKTTVAMELLKRRPSLKKVVTCTTRPIREGETDGVSYHFLDQNTFEHLIEKGAMFEWDKHYEHYYGSRIADVNALIEAGNDVLFVVDVAGAKTIKTEHSEATLIFLEAETVEQLSARLEKRDKGTTAGMEERTAAIEAEMAFAPQADHRITNKEGKLEETIEALMAIMDA